MAFFRLMTLAFKLRRGWARIPPAQRRRLLKQARKHGPTVARGVRKAAKQARKLR